LLDLIFRILPGYRPLELALVRGMMRGTDGGIGRLTCGPGGGKPPLTSLPLKLLDPLPLLMVVSSLNQR
jgi:hypothetical protein